MKGFKWPPPGSGGVVVVTFKGGQKLDKKEADGKDDARVSAKGRKLCDIKIAMTWIVPRVIAGERFFGEAEDTANTMLKAISPRGPNAGMAWEFTVTGESAETAKIHDVRSVMIDDIEGPNPSPGSGLKTATITASSWTKPTATAGKAKTPDKAEPWSKNTTTKIGTNGNVVGGFSDDDEKPRVNP